MPVTVLDRAERLARWRAVLAIALGTILMATQTQRMDGAGGGPLSWIVTGAIIAAFLVWASGAFRGRAVRGILNDESSDVNRRRALMIGFWNMLLTALVCYALTFLKNYGPRDAIQIILTVGISSVFISFGISELVIDRS